MKYLIILLGAFSLVTTALSDTTDDLQKMLDYVEAAARDLAYSYYLPFLTAYQYDAINFIQNGGIDLFAGTGGNHITFGMDGNSRSLVYGEQSSFGKITYASRKFVPFFAIFHINETAGETEQYFIENTNVTISFESASDEYNASDSEPSNMKFRLNITTNGEGFEAYVIYTLFAMPNQVFGVESLGVFSALLSSPELVNMMSFACDVAEGLPIATFFECIHGTRINQNTENEECVCDSGWAGSSCDKRKFGC